MLLWMLLACRPETAPEYCLERADDADCDGVPDGIDHCPATELEALTDRAGCSERQAAGCMVTPAFPADRAKWSEDLHFRWSGDCDVYLLQLSDDPDFPPGATRTALRTTAQEARVTGTERYWRVVGADDGHSVGWTTDVRELR